MIWIDTLDWPLMEFLDAAWVDHDMPGAQGNTNVQPVTFSEGYSRKLYGHGGIKPAFVNHQRGVGHAPGAAVPLPRRRRARRRCTACARRRATRTRASRSTSSTR